MNRQLAKAFGTVTPGIYRMRCGREAIVEKIMGVGEKTLAFGARNFDPRDMVWKLDGTNYFKKYDLIERVGDLREASA